jgi:hypothetical protein
VVVELLFGKEILVTMPLTMLQEMLDYLKIPRHGHFMKISLTFFL